MKKRIVFFDENNNELLVKELEEGVYSCGSKEPADFLLPLTNIDPIHLEFRVNAFSVYFTNLGPPGSVQKNGESRETGDIHMGDEILIANQCRAIVEDFQTNVGVSRHTKTSKKIQNITSIEKSSNNTMFGNVALKNDSDNKYELAPQVVSQLESKNAPHTHSTTLPESWPVNVVLYFREGPRKGEEIHFTTYEITLGRGKSADIYLNDKKLSRIHAKISKIGKSFRLFDLKSKNGTYVNGIRIIEHPLQSLDIIALGKTKIEFVIHEDIQQNPKKIASTFEDLEKKNQEQTNKIVEKEKNFSDGTTKIEPKFDKEFDFENEVTKVSQIFVAIKKKNKIFGLVLLLTALVFIFFLIPSKPQKVAHTEVKKEVSPSAASKDIPQSFFESPVEVQKEIEREYSLALFKMNNKDFEEAAKLLNTIHQILPYYKKSRELFLECQKEINKIQLEKAQAQSQKNEEKSLEVYLEEGMQYLKTKDFDRASEAFNSAILLDPNNAIAKKGLKASELKISDITQIPNEEDEEQTRKIQVIELFQKAIDAFTKKNYHEAIDISQKILAIEIESDTQYKLEAQKLIDRARQHIQEEFEPFIVQANQRFNEGDYAGSRDLCEMMTQKDPTYKEAIACLERAKKQMTRLAREAYIYGYILESMNRLDEAKQYWNKGKAYVRPGDEYYDKIINKLDYYQ